MVRPVMAPVVHFIIPLRAAGSCQNWDVVATAFRGTMASLLNQSDPGWRATVLCHDIPDESPEDPRIEMLQVDLPVPTNRHGFLLDKQTKIKRGLAVFDAGDAAFCMMLDADDRVHTDLVAHVRTAPHSILLVDDGYVYAGGRLVRRHAGTFDRLCGSVVLFPRSLSARGIHPVLWPHFEVRQNAARHDCPVRNLPFPAVVKNVEYGGNLTQAHFLLGRTLRRTMRNISMMRRLGPQLRATFALDTHP